jgi:hypothetical protein
MGGGRWFVRVVAATRDGQGHVEEGRGTHLPRQPWYDAMTHVGVAAHDGVRRRCVTRGKSKKREQVNRFPQPDLPSVRKAVFGGSKKRQSVNGTGPCNESNYHL